MNLNQGVILIRGGLTRICQLRKVDSKRVAVCPQVFAESLRCRVGELGIILGRFASQVGPAQAVSFALARQQRFGQHQGSPASATLVDPAGIAG